MEKDRALHIVMFPWLAMGHLLPYFRLSKLLARHGHKISFISTPKNLSRLPKPPSTLSSQITLIPLALPEIPSLPPDAESSIDVPHAKQQLLKAAFDLLRQPLEKFLERARADWVIYDYASHWLPPLAAELGISCAFFSLFTAAFLAFFCQPSDPLSDSRSSAEDFTVVPPWIPFESNLAFHLHEVAKHFERWEEDRTGVSDPARFGFAVQGSDVVVVRSCTEFEPEWFGLLRELYQKPVIPIGFLPPVLDDEEDQDDDGERFGIKEWLDRQRVNSVVYVALGTEASLTREELSELALGLEKSELPFFLTLRKSPGSTHSKLEMLPNGFEERVRGRGLVHLGWVPQVKILNHASIGGFLTHCGWNSMIEGLGFGRILILFPILNDQGHNARLLQSKKIGVEIPRDNKDGSFSSDSVAGSVRMAMVEERGEMVRTHAKEMKGLFGNRDMNTLYLDEFIRYLEDKTKPK